MFAKRGEVMFSELKALLVGKTVYDVGSSEDGTNVRLSFDEGEYVLDIKEDCVELWDGRGG